MRTHLFVAPGRAAFGEVLLGLRLAYELHAAGDRVAFLAPRAHRVLLERTPFAHGEIDPIIGALHRGLPDVIRARGVDHVVLLDLLVMLLALGSHRIDPAFLDALPVPVTALDIWDLRASDLRFDLAGADHVLHAGARTLVPHRLVPVPFARPTTPGAYCALPSTTGTADRAGIRAQLGLADTARIVMLTTAQYQVRGLTAEQQQLASRVPAAIVDRCLAIDRDIHVLHVGPRALDHADARYLHHPQVAPADFERFMRGSDLLVTPNQAATGISLAITVGTPALAVIGDEPPRFRVCPLGLYEFMSPILQDNPYGSAIQAVTVDGVGEAVRELMFDPMARSAYIASMRTYEELVRGLPSGSVVLGSIHPSLA